MSRRQHAAQEAAAFIDLENVFGVITKEHVSQYHRRVVTLLNTLPKAVAVHGFALTQFWAVMRTDSPGNAPRPHVGVGDILQINLTKIMQTRGAAMSWCRGTIADVPLIHEMESRLNEKSLPKGIVIVSDDTDFIPVAQKLSDAGHTILVAGNQSHRLDNRWRETADSILHLGEILRS